MIPDKFNMVDMGGIDLIMMQGVEVAGLYSKLVESITQCQYQCLYNWFFDGVLIPPTYVKMEVNENDEVVINEGISVTDADIIRIYSIESPASLISLTVSSNGTYLPPDGIDGFSTVIVDVPAPPPNFFISYNSGDYLTGWYQSRRCNRVLATGSKLIVAPFRYNSGYVSGAFYTLIDYGVVSNVVTGDYVIKNVIESVNIPGYGPSNVYIYGGQNGSGLNGNVIFNSSHYYDNLQITMFGNATGENRRFGLGTEANYGVAYNAMSESLKTQFLTSLLDTL